MKLSKILSVIIIFAFPVIVLMVLLSNSPSHEEPEPELAQSIAKVEPVVEHDAAQQMVAAPVVKPPVKVEAKSTPVKKTAVKKAVKQVSVPKLITPDKLPNKEKVVKRGLYPQGSTRKLALADLNCLTNKQLKIMRNEIYARHSYIFSGKEMNAYFRKQPWYTPRNANVDSKLSEIEKYNIVFIKKLEK